MPLIGMSGVSQVRVGVLGQAMQLRSRQSHTFSGTITTIILKLHSNVCDYLCYSNSTPDHVP